jgi:aminoglycoside phosphotransferase family enzyme
MILEKVKQYIESEGLNTPSREQVLRYKRHYICYRLKRYSRFKLYEIGDLFNRHYATVLNAIKAHHDLKNDKIYLETIEETKQFFDRIKFDEEITKRDLYKDVLCATSIYSLNKIKDYMDKGAYEHYKQQTEQL